MNERNESTWSDGTTSTTIPDIGGGMEAQKRVIDYLERSRLYETLAARAALHGIVHAEDVDAARALARTALGWPEPILDPDDYRLPGHVPEPAAWVAEKLREMDAMPIIEPADCGWQSECFIRGCTRHRHRRITFDGPPLKLLGTEEPWDYTGYETDPPPSVDGG